MDGGDTSIEAVAKQLGLSGRSLRLHLRKKAPATTMHSVASAKSSRNAISLAAPSPQVKSRTSLGSPSRPPSSKLSNAGPA
jgi:hypothetical protein